MGEIVTVNFRGDELYGFKQDDGVFVALKPICEAMGLAWEGQRQRVNRDPILSEGTCMMQVPFGRGGPQEVTCIKMDLVNGWLFGIDSSRIKDLEVRERVILYQRECYGVLFKHFYKGGLLESEDAGDPNMALPVGERRKLVTEARQSYGTAASRALWCKLGLPMVPQMMVDEAAQPDLFVERPHANDGKPLSIAA